MPELDLCSFFSNGVLPRLYMTCNHDGLFFSEERATVVDDLIICMCRSSSFSAVLSMRVLRMFF